MKKTELSDHFTWKKLLLYSLPAIGNALAITSFQLIDGGFVSNFLGVTPFAAVNLISPLFFMFYAVGFMFGAGTSALVSQCMGEGDGLRARRIFSMSLTAMTAAGLVLGVLAAVWMPHLAVLFRADENNLEYCVEYGRMLMVFLPLHLINAAFLTLWITAGKAWLGFAVSVINGAGNALLDWLFMGPLKWGVRGAALATSLASAATALIILGYFSRTKTASLSLVRFSMKDFRELGRICYNGLSEMMDSVAGNFTQMIINSRLLFFFGEVGVAAMGVFLYVISVFMAFFLGISETAVTVVGYKCGEKDGKEIHGILKGGLVLMLSAGAVAGVLCLLFSSPIAGLYLGYSDEAFRLSVHVLKISSLACLFYGVVLYCSSFFTGMGDGTASMLISVCMSVAGPIAMVYLLPSVFGRDAIWFAMPASAVLAALLCVGLLRTRYVRRIQQMNSEKQSIKESGL